MKCSHGLPYECKCKHCLAEALSKLPPKQAEQAQPYTQQVNKVFN